MAGILSRVEHTEEMLAAALLHDVVEDTPATLEEIEREFGASVASLVIWLTECEHGDGNRATRKAGDRARLAQAPGQAQTIKLADLLENTASIVAHDPGFAHVYLHEKATLLEVLVQGDACMRREAQAMLRDAWLRLDGNQAA